MVYLSAWNAETGEFRQGVIFVTVEEEPPHLVSLVQLSERTMELGREDYLRRLALYEECMATGFLARVSGVTCRGGTG